MVEKIENLTEPLEKVLEELMDGDIIVFQKEERDNEMYELPTCRDYFKYVQSIQLLQLVLLLSNKQLVVDGSFCFSTGTYSTEWK